MGIKVDNAIIMAAGTSSRFVPISYEMPKGLLAVKGEVLIERQIRQLHEAGIEDVIIVTGYMAERFAYLKDKCGVVLVHNSDYQIRNNNASIYAVGKYLKNSYLCSADNFFSQNPFEAEVEGAYYAGVFAKGKTEEWCMHEDENGFIDDVTIGGADSWIMLGHTFWDEQYSKTFLDILVQEYNDPRIAGLLWEAVYREHLDVLKMKIKKYPKDFIFEFDTLDELRTFDESYINHPRSNILALIADELQTEIGQMHGFMPVKDKKGITCGFEFLYNNQAYRYLYEDKKLLQEYKNG